MNSASRDEEFNSKNTKIEAQNKQTKLISERRTAKSSCGLDRGDDAKHPLSN